MTVLTAGFNPAGAVNGASIATTDAGDLSAWELVNAGANQTYDNTHTLFGKALAGKFSYTAAAGFLEWTTSYGSPADDYGRFYIYLDTLPNATVELMQVVASSGLAIYIDTSGHVIIGLATGATFATSTTALGTAQWYRLEYHVKVTGSSFPSTIDIYTSPDSSTSAETVTGTANWGTANAWALGCTDTSHTFTFHVAQIAIKGTAAIGPYPVNSVAPTVSGSAPVGSVLTAANGTWNGTFNYTYQWTSNGTNIVGATSSTYTTVAGDVGNAIGCKVTAAGQQATNESSAKASSNTITVTSGSGGGGSSTLALASHPARFLRQKGIR